MVKKMVKGLLVAGAMLGMVSTTAVAADYELNLYGASAQHKFWLNLAPDYLGSAGANCATVNQYAYNKKHGMAIGENCAFPAAGDNIIIRYSSRASYDGINAVRTGTTRSMCNATDDCASLVATVVNLGASDVAAESFVQQTSGWEDGNQSFPGALYYANAGTLSFPTEDDVADLEQFNPIVVPFGFLVNNKATEYICTAPAPAEGAAVDHKAYNTLGNSCVPDSIGTGTTTTGQSGVSSDCTGFYKCIDGVCNGGLNAGNSCDEADDCPDVELADTYCKEVPVQNITQSMAQAIFSGNVTDWSDFGPEYPAQAIVRCMRHAGSGTHATMDLAVMDGVAMITNSVPNQTWHFTSSSDLTKCVADFDGAVGYVDADKLLTFEGIDGGVAGAHLAKYNGANASRRNIVWGVYEFWAAQHVYYEEDDFTGDYSTLLNDIIDFSSDPANLTSATLGNAADYWGAQSEMQVYRTVDGGVIKH